MPPERSRRPMHPPERGPGPAPMDRLPGYPGNAAIAERLRNGGGRPVPEARGNAAVQDSLSVAPAAPAVAPAVSPASPGTGPAAPAAATDAPAWAATPHVAGTLKEGAKGAGVEALQAALGIAVTGDFDVATKAAVVAYQVKHSLGDDGIAGDKTLRKLGLRDDLRSASHSSTAFIPTYRATAYSESDSYRTKADPYAVGAITRPTADDDDGGKTYGTYQFESFIYKDGSKKSDSAVADSTIMRFVNWSDNPYRERLSAVVKKNGVASAEFDTLWGELTGKENKAFGKAQEKFLQHDVGGKVTAFFDAAKVPASLRTDPDLYDVAIGTLNQYNTLTASMATALAARIAKMSAPTADQVGAALQDIKSGNVKSNFKSSPNAWDGINARIDREKALFTDTAEG
jgi:hypothetical protein